MEYEFRWYRNRNEQSWTVPFILQYRHVNCKSIEDDSTIGWSEWQDIPYVEEE